MTFCFQFAVRDEWELATRLVNQLVELYPSCQIICVSDGTDNSEFAQFCKLQNVFYLKGKYLHLLKHGGAWCERMFQTFLRYSIWDSCIRIEPDTWLNRKFNNIPDADVAGNIIKVTSTKKYIHGGCVLFKKTVVEKILNSGLLQNIKYKTQAFGYFRFQPPYLLPEHVANRELHGAHDVIFSDVVWRLKLQVAEWDEVFSRVREECLTPAQFAAIHPLKTPCA